MANQDGFIKDRGNIKWTAMMLPEHREMLSELGLRELDVDPPFKNGDELAELAERIARALQDEEMVTLSFWKNKRKNLITGIVKKIDPRMKAVLIEVNEDEKSWIPAPHIFGLE